MNPRVKFHSLRRNPFHPRQKKIKYIIPPIIIKNLHPKSIIIDIGAYNGDSVEMFLNSFRDIDRQEIQDMTWDKYTEKRWKSILDSAIDKTIENFKSNRGVLPI